MEKLKKPTGFHFSYIMVFIQKLLGTPAMNHLALILDIYLQEPIRTICVMLQNANDYVVRKLPIAPRVMNTQKKTHWSIKITNVFAVPATK